MKKILVVCGNGIASSSIMVSVLQDFLKEEKIEAQVDKSSLMACTSDTFNSYDLVVSSTKLDNPAGNDSNLLIVFYVQIMPDDFVMQLHRF